MNMEIRGRSNLLTWKNVHLLLFDFFLRLWKSTKFSSPSSDHLDLVFSNNHKFLLFCLIIIIALYDYRLYVASL